MAFDLDDFYMVLFIVALFTVITMIAAILRTEGLWNGGNRDDEERPRYHRQKKTRDLTGPKKN